MSGPWLQPHEGVTGVDRKDTLLSLDPAMVPLRTVVAATAAHLHAACLVGNPAPRVAEMYARITSPMPGDLVIEDSARHGWRRWPDKLSRGMGVLVLSRREWAETDEEWAAYVAEEQSFHTDPFTDDRSTDVGWYVQYGPGAADVCRWVNCGFIAIPWPGEHFDPYMTSSPVRSWDAP